MKFSLSWIREFVDVSSSPAELARRLTSAGLPVETIAEGSEGDVILDVEIFSNRPDCMNVYGVAREVSAATGRNLCPYPRDIAETPGAPAAADLVRVEIEEPDLCGRYTSRLIQGVRIGPSPIWLARRLESVGLRPVNNVVDVTNYVLWEYGHPLHAFDFDTLAQRRIRVRRAARGESIVTLDGVSRTLAPEMLVIADAERPVAIAGVMGGAATMVSARTSSLLLESAWFDPVSVRRTSKKLALSTDASYRFERGADIEAADAAIHRAAGLILEVAGGSLCPGLIDERPRPPAHRRLSLRPARAAMLLGMPVDPAAIERVLPALGFSLQRREDRFEVEVPSHRQDIDREVDLIEEVGRGLGYDAVPERLPHIRGSGGVRRSGHRQEAAIRRALGAAGYNEAMTTSFTTAAVDWALRQRLDEDEPAIEPIAPTHPIASDQEILRTTLLPGLLASAARNINRGVRDVRLFEIGRTFRRGPAPPPGHEDRKHTPVGPVEEILSLGIVASGNVRPPHWMEPPREATFYDVKGIIAALLAEAGLRADVARLSGAQALDPGCSALVLASAPGRQEARPVGRVGSLTAEWRERLDLRQEVVAAELNLSGVFSLQPAPVAFKPLPRFPAVSRDLSLVVPVGKPFIVLERAVREAAPERVVAVSVFDRYLGDALPPGSEGLGITIVFQHPDRTLSTQEIEESLKRILDRLTTEFGVRLRG